MCQTSIEEIRRIWYAMHSKDENGGYDTEDFEDDDDAECILLSD